MTIYLDIVFLENFILNYIILFATSIISKSKTNIIRIIISSVIGGIFSIINYFIKTSSFLGIILKIIISIIMILIAFYEHKSMLKQLIFFYLVSFTFGGIAFMLLFVMMPQNLNLNRYEFSGTYPLKVAILAGGMGFIVIGIVAQIIKSRRISKLTICDLEIFYKGKTRIIKTLLDTGNMLKEPITNLDVIIVEKNSLNGLISDEILKNIDNIIKGKWIDSEGVHEYKFKLIPFASLGNENGILIGFKPDYIKIYEEDEHTRNDVFIGIYNGKLSKNNLYTSLIGLNILNKT